MGAISLFYKNINNKKMTSTKKAIEELRFLDGMRYGLGYAMAIVKEKNSLIKSKELLDKMYSDTEERKREIISRHNLKEI